MSHHRAFRSLAAIDVIGAIAATAARIIDLKNGVPEPGAGRTTAPAEPARL